MDSSRIRSSQVRGTSGIALRGGIPSQGQLLHELLESLNKAKPASGKRDASPQEIGEALKLKGDDLTRFMPLVTKATISSDGKMTLALREDFQFKPHPEADDLIIKMQFGGTVTPGKLVVTEGLEAAVTFINVRIKLIEDAVENNVPGVRIEASLATRFFPI